MSKRILIKEAGLMDFFKSFFKAKADGKESEWLQRLRKVDPKMADVWTDYDDTLSAATRQQKKDLESLGIDTSHIDQYIKKYGIK